MSGPLESKVMPGQWESPGEQIARLGEELREANQDWKRMNAQRKRANRQAKHWRERAKAAEAEVGERQKEEGGLYACPTCEENVTRYGQRCPRCTRNLEEDRLERESGR